MSYQWNNRWFISSDLCQFCKIFFLWFFFSCLSLTYIFHIKKLCFKSWNLDHILYPKNTFNAKLKKQTAYTRAEGPGFYSQCSLMRVSEKMIWLGADVPNLLMVHWILFRFQQKYILLDMRLNVSLNSFNSCVRSLGFEDCHLIVVPCCCLQPSKMKTICEAIPSRWNTLSCWEISWLL